MASLFRLIAVTLNLVLLITLTGCSFQKAEIGSEQNPLKLLFVPAQDAKVLNANSQELKAYLEANTPYKFKVLIPHNFIAVVEAFGSKRADISVLNTFGYILANEKYGAEAHLTVLSNGKATYSGQIITRVDSKIEKLEDLANKKFAFVDPASASGYLLPMKLIKDAKVPLGETIFALKHDNVVSMVYQKNVDAGATFYTPPVNGEIQDARRLVKTQHPDVEQKIKILRLTEEIPNDPVVFRKDLPTEVKEKVTQTLLTFVTTPEGQKVLKNLYGVTGLKPATDQDYDSVRTLLKDLGKTAAQQIK